MTLPGCVPCETHKTYRGKSTPNQPCLACLRIYFEQRANTYREDEPEGVTYDDMVLLIQAIRAECAAADMNRFTQSSEFAEQVLETIAGRITEQGED